MLTTVKTTTTLSQDAAGNTSPEAHKAKLKKRSRTDKSGSNPNNMRVTRTEISVETKPLTLENVTLHTLITGGQAHPLFTSTNFSSVIQPQKRGRSRRRNSTKSSTLKSSASYAIQENPHSIAMIPFIDSSQTSSVYSKKKGKHETDGASAMQTKNEGVKQIVNEPLSCKSSPDKEIYKRCLSENDFNKKINKEAISPNKFGKNNHIKRSSSIDHAATAHNSENKENVKSPSENVKSPSENVKSPSENVKSPSENAKSPSENVKSPSENVKSPSENVKSRSENVKSPSENVKSPSENVKLRSENVEGRKTSNNNKESVNIEIGQDDTLGKEEAVLCTSTPNTATSPNEVPKRRPKSSVARELFGKNSIFFRSKSLDRKHMKTTGKRNTITSLDDFKKLQDNDADLNPANKTLTDEPFPPSPNASNCQNKRNNQSLPNSPKKNDPKCKNTNKIENVSSACVSPAKPLFGKILRRSSSVNEDLKATQISSGDPGLFKKDILRRSKSLDSRTNKRNSKKNKTLSSPEDSPKSKGLKSSDSVSNMVENVKACLSLIEISKVTPRPDSLVMLPNIPEKKERKRERTSQQQRSFRIKKSDPRRKSADFTSFAHHRQMIEKPPDPGLMYPDTTDGKMLSKASRVLQEHVSDKNKTNMSCLPVGKPTTIYKENAVIPNYNTNEQIIADRISGITYVRGRLLGKGGFAKCYEMIDTKTNKAYAGKIISKSRLSKPHQRDKIAREIDLHKNLRHKNVVGFHSYFEDEHNVYIILEICSRKSLVHVLKQRKTLTEPEVRFYLTQLVSGTRYIHNQNIIHRDLKLGNMLLNESMNVKIADFGLATRVEYEGEKKMTVCGTPNYIAPEVLQKKGHSYEADVWAMGCVMYAMLVGRPPFETATLKETYMRITANKYFVPPHVSRPAKHLIQKLLHPDPESRPTLDKIVQDEFFTSGYFPKNLPTSCCDSAPKWPSSSHGPQRPKSYAAPVSPSEAMQKITSSLANWKGSKKSASQILTRQSAKDDIQVATNDLRDQEKSQQSVISDSRKSSRDRSPHHSNHSRSRSAGDTRRHGDRHHPERSASPPKSPRQVVIETKPVHHTPKTVSNNPEANNNVINSQLNGYHPGMVLCSPPPAHHGSQRSTFSQPSVAQTTTTTTHSSNTQLSKSPSRTSMAQQQQQQHIQSVTEIKSLPAGSAIRLYQMLSTCLDQMPKDSSPTPVHSAKPLWVTKWVDYSNKYGFGFQLSDKGVGVLFNDTTRMLLAPDGKTVQYNDLSNRVYTFSTDTTPSEHQKKSTLLLYFAQYMGEHLIHGGNLLQHQAGAAAAIFMKKWFRTSKAIVMYLNNGTLQVNFFDDHTKVILSPEGQDYLVTYINSHRQAISYRLLQFRHFGCSSDIAERLSYARKMLEGIINIEGETV